MFFMNTKDTSLLWDLLFHNRSLYLALSPNNFSRHFTSCHHDPRTDTINTYYFEWTVLGGKVNQMLFFVNVKRKEVKFEKKNHLDGCHLCSDRWIGLKVIQSVKVTNTTEKHISCCHHLKVLFCFDLQVIDQLVEQIRLLFHAAIFKL